jgi:Na+-translocating ferredoxin:NAD+ oxidoreductase RNF subunit RnfB
MENPYRKLAARLDEIPNGFPPTENGIELKLLAKLFTPEEADLASSMSLNHQTIKMISENNNLEESKVKSLLISMVKKGLIDLKKQEGVGLIFSLIPFVVGFYERQNARIDKEFAELFELYYKDAFHKPMTIEPSVHRIIPIEKTVPVDIDVMPYEKASTYLDNAKSWGVLNCICRVQKRLIGKGCDHKVENCLVFSSRPGAFDRMDDIRSITREEALEILAEADREGLVHSTSNTRDEVTYICNCCTCSCGVLRGIVEYGSKSSVARSDFYATIDSSLCSGCEICIDRCQFNALSMNDGVSVVDTSNCYGCGLCVTACPEEAITLKLKNPEELIPPPATEEEWRIKRETERKKVNLSPLSY